MNCNEGSTTTFIGELMPQPTKKQRFTENNIKETHDGPGVYRLYEGPKMTYIGSSEDVSERLGKHHDNGRFNKTTSFDYLRTESTREARKLEERQIEKYNPPKNHK